MFFLLAVIGINVYLAIIFKLFPRFRINALQAIVVNYWVCVATGSFFLGRFPISAESIQLPSAPYALLVGLLLVSLFNLIAWSVREAGITATTVANKLSLVIPAVFAVWYYSESLGPFKIAGVLLAFPAVYLSSKSKTNESDIVPKSILWPLLLFVGSGVLDSLFTLVTNQFFNTGNVLQDNVNNAVFLVHSFCTAAVLGTLFLCFQFVKGRAKWDSRNLLAGILLGIPNFFSMYFLVRLLNSGLLQASAAIPISNIAVVLLASIIAILVFKEKATRNRMVGILLAMLAIALIFYSDYK